MHTGGTSGPLFGMWFAQLARAAGGAAEIGLAELAAVSRPASQGIQRLGGAEPGDKTMVDALAPAVRGAADGRSETARHSPPGSRQQPRRPRAGADATAPMLARRGRASYVGEAARGVCDPGALTVALFFESST